MYLFFWQMKMCLPSAPMKFSSSIISMAVRNTGLRVVSRAIWSGGHHVISTCCISQLGECVCYIHIRPIL